MSDQFTIEGALRKKHQELVNFLRHDTPSSLAPAHGSEKCLAWEYSRSSLTHYAGPYGDGGEEEGHERKWMIRDCREYGTYHKPSDGYDLLRWGRVVGHAKTVKQLKIMAGTFQNDKMSH